MLLHFLYGDVGKYSSGWGAYAEYGIVGDAKAYISHGMGPGTKEFDDSFTHRQSSNQSMVLLQLKHL